MRRWVMAARRRYGVEPGTIAAQYDEATPTGVGDDLPPLTRSGPFGLLSMRVRRSITDATYAVERDDGTRDVVSAAERPGRAETDSPAVVTVEERLDVSTWVLALVAAAALIAITGGVAVIALGVGGLATTLATVSSAVVLMAVADGYTRLRDPEGDPLAKGVLHESAEPVVHWLVGTLVGVAVLAVAPRWLRLIAVGWLTLLLVIPLVGPLRRAGRALSAWLHGRTVVSESRATFPGPAGTPFGGGIKRRLVEAEARTDLRLLPTFVGEWTAGDARCRYTFTFRSVDGGTEVIQRVALRRTVWAMQVLIMPVLTVGLLWAGWLGVEAGVGQDLETLSLSARATVGGIVRQLLVVAAIFSIYVGVAGPTMLRLSWRPNLLAEVQELGDRYLRVETTFDAVFAIPAGACLLLGVFRGEKRLLVLSGAFIACQLLVVAVGITDGRPLLWFRRTAAELVGGTPVAARYARALVLLLLPLATIGFGEFALGPLVGDAVALPPLDLLWTGCLCLFAGMVAVDLATEEFGASRHAARRKSVTPWTVAVGLAVVAACSLATYAALGYALELWILDGAFGFEVRPYSPFRMSLFAATLLVLTVPAGAVIQALIGVRGRLGPPADAERLTSDPAEHIDAPVYVVDSDVPYSEASGTYGGDPYIVLSTAMLTALDDGREVAAILAHEQAHINHGDTTLGLVLPLVGALTLTGQSVLFDLFDVREREHRADVAAVRSLDSPDPLLSAFDRLDDLPERARDGRPAGTGTLGALPTGGFDGGARSLLVRPFRLLFGLFALTDVHPSIADRRQRVLEVFGTE